VVYRLPDDHPRRTPAQVLVADMSRLVQLCPLGLVDLPRLGGHGVHETGGTPRQGWVRIAAFAPPVDERAGFEPAMEISPHTRFSASGLLPPAAVCHVQLENQARCRQRSRSTPHCCRLPLP
jgi:hypothetical protein